jgi:hypothetical protein
MSWTEHVGLRGEKIINKLLMGEPEGNSHLEDLGIDGRIIHIHILKN